MHDNQYIKKLRAKGERITPIRSALVDILTRSKTPRTVPELLDELQEHGYKANKTTIYRQLETLLGLNIIQEVHLADRSTYYEIITESGHHHHLVCLECHKIEDVVFATDLDVHEKKIWKKYGFKVIQHSLEFFGLCKKCRLKIKSTV